MDSRVSRKHGSSQGLGEVEGFGKGAALEGPGWGGAPQDGPSECLDESRILGWVQLNRPGVSHGHLRLMGITSGCHRDCT